METTYRNISNLIQTGDYVLNADEVRQLLQWEIIFASTQNLYTFKQTVFRYY